MVSLAWKSVAPNPRLLFLGLITYMVTDWAAIRLAAFRSNGNNAFNFVSNKHYAFVTCKGEQHRTDTVFRFCYEFTTLIKKA